MRSGETMQDSERAQTDKWLPDFGLHVGTFMLGVACGVVLSAWAFDLMLEVR